MIQCRCGQQYPSDYPHCPTCGLSAEHGDTTGCHCPHSRSIYILLALLFGGLGVHNFYAARTAVGFGQIGLTAAGILISPFLWTASLIWIVFDIVAVTTDGGGQIMG